MYVQNLTSKCLLFFELSCSQTNTHTHTHTHIRTHIHTYKPRWLHNLLAEVINSYWMRLSMQYDELSSWSMSLCNNSTSIIVNYYMLLRKALLKTCRITYVLTKPLTSSLKFYSCLQGKLSVLVQSLGVGDMTIWLECLLLKEERWVGWNLCSSDLIARIWDFSPHRTKVEGVWKLVYGRWKFQV